MICNADFDELFPWTVRPERRRATGAAPAIPKETCIARWENEGGRANPAPPRDMAMVAPVAENGYMVSDRKGLGPTDAPVRAAIALTMLPIMSAYAAASIVAATYGTMTDI